MFSFSRSRRGALAAFAIIGLMLTVLLLGTAKNVYAAGQFSLSPSVGSVNNGGSFSVTLRINPGTNITSVETTISYDASKVQYQSLSYSGTQLAVGLLENISSGTIRIDRGNITPVAGDILIAKLNFKAITGSGTAGFSVSGNAELGGSYINPTGGSANVTLKTPPTSDPDPTPTDPTPTPTDPTPSPTPSNPSNGGSGNNNPPKDSQSPNQGIKPATPTKAETPGAVSIQDSPVNSEFTKAKTTITTSEASKVSIAYGTSQDNLAFTTPETELGTSHEVVFDENLLIPGTTYYYQISAINGKGEAFYSEVKSFKTKGYTLRLTILDKEKKPFKNKTIELHSDPLISKTDNKGVVEFNDVPPGEHTVVYSKGSKKYEQKIAVDDVAATGVDGIQTAAVQNVSVIYGEVNQSNLLLTGITISAVAAVIALIIYLGYRSGYAQAFMSNLNIKKRSSTVTSGIVTQNSPTSIQPTTTNPESIAIHPTEQKAEPTENIISKIHTPKEKNPGSLIQPTVEKKDDNDA